MTQEKKQEFTRRLSCCNRGGMVVVMYDILFAYLEDAEESHPKDYGAFKASVGKAQQVIRRLMDDLDFTYPIAGSLYGAYQFANKHLSLAVCKNGVQNVRDAKRVLGNLYEGFVEAARQDTSEPLMQHTQQVVAGMTYQKGNLTETLQGSENSRGFLA
ncbi:MAG: flagellar protein FliS [Lachnospiraceae bacterium]|jgi:flagellar protein FliS|nr:flagellar protein FliS [Lachnospiraceae bacterium]